MFSVSLDIRGSNDRRRIDSPVYGIESASLETQVPMPTSMREGMSEAGVAQLAGVSESDAHSLVFISRSQVHKPGKLGYLAPELYSNHCWEAYKVSRTQSHKARARHFIARAEL